MSREIGLVLQKLILLFNAQRGMGLPSGLLRLAYDVLKRPARNKTGNICVIVNRSVDPV